MRRFAFLLLSLGFLVVLGLWAVSTPASAGEKLRVLLLHPYNETFPSSTLAGMRAMLRKDSQDRALIDINEVVEEVLGFVRPEFDRHEVSVRSVLTEGLPQVSANRIQLQQMVVNLVRNAIEAMSSVTGRARVLQVRSEADEDGDVIIAIKDTGPAPRD